MSRNEPGPNGGKAKKSKKKRNRKSKEEAGAPLEEDKLPGLTPGDSVTEGDDTSVSESRRAQQDPDEGALNVNVNELNVERVIGGASASSGAGLNEQKDQVKSSDSEVERARDQATAIL